MSVIAVFGGVVKEDGGVFAVVGGVLAAALLQLLFAGWIGA